MDYVFIMSYDERSQIRGPCVAGPNSPYNWTLTGNFQIFTVVKQLINVSFFSVIAIKKGAERKISTVGKIVMLRTDLDFH